MRNYQYNNLTIGQFNNRKGVTLIELAMVIVIVGILAGVSSMYIKETIDLWRFLTFRNEVVSQGRMALARMTREIRQANEISTCYSSEIEFMDINGNTINFRLSGNNLMRNTDILAGDVNELNFIYYDETGLPPSSCLDIYRINIELQIQSGDQTKTLKSQIYPRNL